MRTIDVFIPSSKSAAAPSSDRLSVSSGNGDTVTSSALASVLPRVIWRCTTAAAAPFARPSTVCPTTVPSVYATIRFEGFSFASGAAAGGGDSSACFCSSAAFSASARARSSEEVGILRA